MKMSGDECWVGNDSPGCKIADVSIGSGGGGGVSGYCDSGSVGDDE